MSETIQNEPQVLGSLLNGIEEPLGVVLYTDGGARPQNGYIGWGAHGYLYAMKPVKKPVIVEGHEISELGYLKPNDKRPCARVEPIYYFDFLGSQIIHGTNNSAEVQSLAKSLQHLEKYDLKEISIFTDSEYVRNGATDWCFKWDRANWRKQDNTPVVNAEWWKMIHQKLVEYKEKGIKFSISWVQAHVGIFGNTHADTLATIAISYSRNGEAVNQFTTTDAKKYWKKEITRHPFINFKRLYFNSVKCYNMLGSYFLADPGATDAVFGKRIPETGLAVIKFYEQDPIIEIIKERQYEIAAEVNAIILMRLERVYSQEVYPYIEQYGKNCLLAGKNNLNVDFTDEKPITVEVNPTGLSLRSIESFNFLEELLDDYYLLKTKPDYKSAHQFQQHDITKTFFDIEVKKEVNKYTLKPEFGVGFKDIIIEVPELYKDQLVSVKVPLILGTDLLPRNNLKKLETEKPIVTLITWRDSEVTLRYATIIDCTSGVGIWSNFFADKIFINHHEQN